MKENVSSTNQNAGINWKELIEFPSAGETADYNRTSKNRAPYIVGWMKTGGMGRYTEFAIDFKADYVPNYTYCSLANFDLDYSSLNSQYVRVHTDGHVCGYAGFHFRGPGESPAGILSFWEVKCEDKNGRVTNINPTRVYPEPDGDMIFDGEGEGVHCLKDYKWSPGKWYRMLLQCGISETTGNTTVEQWVLDIESNMWTFLCKYDLGVKHVAFINDNAVFLENYNPKASGDVRTMEVKNVRILPEGSPKWVSVRSGYFLQNYNYPGSYRYGTNKDVFWMITTGVSNKAGTRFNDQRRFIERSEAMSVKHCACCGRFVSEPCARTYIDGWHYYIQDYMGNNRMVVNSDGTIEQVTHYYPYGGVIGEIPPFQCPGSNYGRRTPFGG